MKSQYSPMTTFARVTDEMFYSSALQTLAEEIECNRFDLVRACHPFDKTSKSAIDTKTFRDVIKEHCSNITEAELNELVRIAPKDKDNNVLFRELAFNMNVLFYCKLVVVYKAKRSHSNVKNRSQS